MPAPRDKRACHECKKRKKKCTHQGTGYLPKRQRRELLSTAQKAVTAFGSQTADMLSSGDLHDTDAIEAFPALGSGLVDYCCHWYLSHNYTSKPFIQFSELCELRKTPQSLITQRTIYALCGYTLVQGQANVPSDLLEGHTEAQYGWSLLIRASRFRDLAENNTVGSPQPCRIISNLFLAAAYASLGLANEVVALDQEILNDASRIKLVDDAQRSGSKSWQRRLSWLCLVRKRVVAIRTICMPLADCQSEIIRDVEMVDIEAQEKSDTILLLTARMLGLFDGVVQQATASRPQYDLTEIGTVYGKLVRLWEESTGAIIPNVQYIEVFCCYQWLRSVVWTLTCHSLKVHDHGGSDGEINFPIRIAKETGSEIKRKMGTQPQNYRVPIMNEYLVYIAQHAWRYSSLFSFDAEFGVVHGYASYQGHVSEVGQDFR